MKRLEGLVPGRGVGRGTGLGPKAGWIFQFGILGVAAKIQDVPLRNPHVFQEPPGGVRETGYFYSAQLGREIGNRRVEIDVGAAAAQQVKQMLPQSRLVI